MSSDIVYFLIPDAEVTDDMVETANQNSRATIRRSTNLYDGMARGLHRTKGMYIHAVLSWKRDAVPTDVRHRYKALELSEALQLLNEPEWNDLHAFWRALGDFDPSASEALIRSGNPHEGVGRAYTALFGVLKLALLCEFRARLGVDHARWKTYRERFWKANEKTVLEMAFLFEVIDAAERDVLDRFRCRRNDLAHAAGQQIDEDAIVESVLHVGLVIRALSRRVGWDVLDGHWIDDDLT